MGKTQQRILPGTVHFDERSTHRAVTILHMHAPKNRCNKTDSTEGRYNQIHKHWRL